MECLINDYNGNGFVNMLMVDGCQCVNVYFRSLMPVTKTYIVGKDNKIQEVIMKQPTLTEFTHSTVAGAASKPGIVCF